MLKQMKKTLGILLAVCFLMSVTAAAVSAESGVVKENKEKKTVTETLKDAKTKIFKHHHLHHNKDKTMNGEKGKDMGIKSKTNKNMPTKTENNKNMPIKTESNKNKPMNG